MSKKLFNYNCPVTKHGSTTGIVNGCSDGIINLNNLSYRWAYSLWELMLANTWFPKEVDLTQDVRDYNNLTKGERTLYDRVLSQLIFMDSIQTNNTPDNVNPFITAPEVNMCLVRQSFEEALHSQSYAVMVDSISMNTDEIYEMWRKNDKLRKKNEYIGNVYENISQLALKGDFISQLKMIVANQCLEGIYFYSGFAGMYALGTNGKMVGSSQMIRFIQRDEVTHLQLFANIFKEMIKENQDIYNDNKVFINNMVYNMFKDAVELEVEWGKHITEEGILGLTGELIEKFVKYLANKRLNAIGYKPLYPEIISNPLSWFDKYSDFNSAKTNFFEGNVTNYDKGRLSFDNF